MTQRSELLRMVLKRRANEKVFEFNLPSRVLGWFSDFMLFVVPFQCHSFLSHFFIVKPPQEHNSITILGIPPQKSAPLCSTRLTLK